MKITILYSGGLDSLIMKRFAEVNYAEATVTCLWFDLGQPYNYKERAVLPAFVECRTIEWLQKEGGSVLGKDEGTGNKSGDIYIPGRNAALTTLAACITLPDQIWIGALLGETHDRATDKNQKFLDLTSESLSVVLGPFKPTGIGVRFPLAEAGLNKLTAVQWALENGVSQDVLLGTSSCLSGELGNCGKCVVCLRRCGIFSQLGITEKYNVDPWSVPDNKKIVAEMLKGNGSYYDEHRRSEVLPAVPSWLLLELRKNVAMER